MQALRVVHRFWLVILALALVVQIFLAGLGAFGVAEAVEDAAVSSEGFEDEFGPHAALGHLIWFGTILLFLLALAARVGRTRVLVSLAVVVLGFVQILLAAAGESAPFVGGLHPVNGVLILVLVAWLAERAWRGSAGELPRGTTPPGA